MTNNLSVDIGLPISPTMSYEAYMCGSPWRHDNDHGYRGYEIPIFTSNGDSSAYIMVQQRDDENIFSGILASDNFADIGGATVSWVKWVNTIPVLPEFQHIVMKMRAYDEFNKEFCVNSRALKLYVGSDRIYIMMWDTIPIVGATDGVCVYIDTPWFEDFKTLV